MAEPRDRHALIVRAGQGVIAHLLAIVARLAHARIIARVVNRTAITIRVAEGAAIERCPRADGFDRVARQTGIPRMPCPMGLTNLFDHTPVWQCGVGAMELVGTV